VLRKTRCGLRQIKVYGDAPIPPGEHRVQMGFAYDGGGLGEGSAILHVDGNKVGEGWIDATGPLIFPAGETTDVGSDGAMPVSDDYGPKDDCFTGRVRRVELDIDEAAEDVSHLISPEERFRLAMARQ